MNQGGKVVLGLLALGGIGAILMSSHSANAAPAPSPNPGPSPLPIPELPPIGQIIPPPGTPIPLPNGGTVAMPSIPGVNTPSQPPPGSNPISLPPLFPPGVTPIPNPFAQPPAVVVAPPVQVIPGLVITPGPAPAPSAPPASPTEVPTSAPTDTVALVSKMLAQEHNPHWRIAPEATLVPWQKARGLVSDGMYGPGGALKMAAEIGTLPIIRAWPKGSYPGDGKLDAYRASLQQLANAAPEPRASQLRAAAAREQGQGYGTPETPIAHLITLQGA